MSRSKRSGIDAAVSAMQGEYDDPKSVCRLGDADPIEISAIPTGIPSLDAALGCGGIPRGRISELYGNEGSGKSTVALCALGEAQKLGGQALYVAAEADFNPAWAKTSCGVDTDSLILCQPRHGEQALDVVEKLVLEKIDIAVIDSAAALVPRAELECQMGEAVVGLQARLLSQACRKLGQSAARSNTAIVFVNQLREKIGVMYGNPEVTSAGRALKFWSSIRLALRGGEPIKEGDKRVGSVVKVRVVKNKVAPSFAETEFDIYSGACGCHAAGPDRMANLLDLAVARGAVERTGAWYSFDGERMGQGRLHVAKTLLESPKLAAAVREKIFGGSK